MPIKIFESNSEHASASVEKQMNDWDSSHSWEITHLSTAISGSGAAMRLVATVIYRVAPPLFRS